MDKPSYKNPISQSLFSSKQKERSTIYTLNLAKVSILQCLLTLLLIYLNLCFACFTHFPCESFIPTLMYLGRFGIHDRLFIVSCTFFALYLPISYIGAYYHFKNVAGAAERETMLVLGIISSVSLPLLGLTNEVNESHFVPFEPINGFLYLIFIFSVVGWVFLAYKCLSKMSVSFNPFEKIVFKVLNALIATVAVLLIGLSIELNYAHSIENSYLINERMEGLLDWAILSILVVLPTVFTQFYKSYVLVFTIEHTSNDLELHKVSDE